MAEKEGRFAMQNTVLGARARAKQAEDARIASGIRRLLGVPKLVEVSPVVEEAPDISQHPTVGLQELPPLPSWAKCRLNYGPTDYALPTVVRDSTPRLKVAPATPIPDVNPRITDKIPLDELLRDAPITDKMTILIDDEPVDDLTAPDVPLLKYHDLRLSPILLRIQYALAIFERTYGDVRITRIEINPFISALMQCANIYHIYADLHFVENRALSDADIWVSSQALEIEESSWVL